MMLRRIVVVAVFVLVAAAAAGQGVVRGVVSDRGTSEVLPFVTVQVLSSSGTLVGGAVSDDKGAFRISGLPVGQYSLVLSFVGYTELRRSFAITARQLSCSLGDLGMSEDAHQLDEVRVVAQRSAMRLEVDRKVFDVGSLISAEGASASDLLDNIPSVEVDNDGNISLRGNSSVEVWINGRPSGLTADNRSTILEQLPAESIDRIEVLDNPSSKFSAEGSAGIINIVLKKDRKAGYYGSVRVGGNTNLGANTAVNINYNSSIVDIMADVGYRHRVSKGSSASTQDNYTAGVLTGYNNYTTLQRRIGNNLFSRLAVTFHATERDDLVLTGMLMKGGTHGTSDTPYYYGDYDAAGEGHGTYTLYRLTTTSNSMLMLHGEVAYTHSFRDDHKLDVSMTVDKWNNADHSFYQDHSDYSLSPAVSPADVYTWQYRPQFINNLSYEVKADYENKLSEHVKIEGGYDFRRSHENTPQLSYTATGADGLPPEIYASTSRADDYEQYEDPTLYNRFVYDMDVHAVYCSATYNIGKFGVLAGVRGEYWRVSTTSSNWAQDHGGASAATPYCANNFQLFPSLFLSYQCTADDQLQVNYTRRLQRPRGGDLNSFRDTRDATMITFGNPALSPEFSNSLSLNYLRTWTEHSLLVSLYYRPTSDVIQRIRYRDSDEEMMYTTPENVAQSTAAGGEITVKNHLFRYLDLTTNINAYYYKLNAFDYLIDGQEVEGAAQERFTWNVRMQFSLLLPYDISVQLNGRYNSRRAITQGHQPAAFFMDVGIRKNFWDKMFTVAVNCRDLLDSHAWKSVTGDDTYWRYQENRRNSRNVSLTLTWNFGNMKGKKSAHDDHGDDNG